MSLSRREVIGTGVALASLRAEAAATDAGSALVNPPTARACTDRMPEIPAVRQTEAQKKASAEFYAGRKVAVFGPFVPLLRSPEVMLRAKAMGDYLRYQSSLPPKLNELTIEPWRARAFPVIKDLVVDRSAFDRIVEAGGFVSVPTGSAPDGNAVPVPKDAADRSMDAAAWAMSASRSAGSREPLSTALFAAAVTACTSPSWSP